MAGPFDKVNDLIKDIIEDNTVALHKSFTLDMGAPIARDTPVDTGRATAGWRVGINREPTPNNNLFDKTPAATPTINRMRADLSGLKFGDTVIMKNAVSSPDDADYIIKLENGSSQQAPTGMFKKNVVRYKQIAKKTKKRLGL